MTSISYQGTVLVHFESLSLLALHPPLELTLLSPFPSFSSFSWVLDIDVLTGMGMKSCQSLLSSHLLLIFVSSSIHVLHWLLEVLARTGVIDFWYQRRTVFLPREWSHRPLPKRRTPFSSSSISWLQNSIMNECLNGYIHFYLLSMHFCYLFSSIY